MRSALLAASVCLLSAGVAAAQTPQAPAPGTIPVPGGTPPELAPSPTVGIAATETRPFDMTGPRVWATADYLVMWYTPMRTPPLIQAIPSGLVARGCPTALPSPSSRRRTGSTSARSTACARTSG